MSTLFTVDSLSGIEMKCHGEGEYKSPEVMRSASNEPLYAYVALVMLGDSYVPAAAVLAQSLRLLRTEADIVAMVTDDVSKEGRLLLSRFFTRVVTVDLIKIPHKRARRKGREYLSYVFTKFHALTLTRYEKVLLIDADALVLDHPDHLFTLGTPAGVLLERKEHFICYDGTEDKNYVLPPNMKIRWYEEYCDCCAHGKRIDKHITDRLHRDRDNHGIGGGLVLLSPKSGELESILRDVNQGRYKKMVGGYFCWPEQQYMTVRYSGRWHSINPVFFGLQGYPHWKVLYGLQYAGSKPFSVKFNETVEEKLKYPDCQLWHMLFGDLLASMPDIRGHPSIAEAERINSYFSPKGLPTLTTDSSARAARILRLANGAVDDQQPFYHTEWDLPYRGRSTKLLYNLDSGDYVGMLDNLVSWSEKMDSGYFNDLRSELGNAKKGEVRLDMAGLSQSSSDAIATYYAMCRRGALFVTLWPLSSAHYESVVGYLNRLGTVVYVRKVSLSYPEARAMMYGMFLDLSSGERVRHIDRELAASHVRSDASNEVVLILFDSASGLPTLGWRGSEPWKRLREFVAGLVPESSGEDELVHVSSYHSDTVEYCQMMFNENSRKLLSWQAIDFLSDHCTSHCRLNTLKKLTHEAMPRLDATRLLVSGGAVLYSAGVRESGVVNGVFANTHSSSPGEADFLSAVERFFDNESTRFEFLGICVEGSSRWSSLSGGWNVDALKAVGSASIDELVLNPKHHYYFGGIKMIAPEYEMAQKFTRLGGQDIADLVVAYYSYGDNIGSLVNLDESGVVVLPTYAAKSCDGGEIAKAHELIGERYAAGDHSSVSADVVERMFSSICRR